jgi:hypothetical protein
VLLSEIEANPPGMDDNRYEYVELAGTPNLSLTNDYFVTFDGSAGTTGVADLVVNLTGYSLGSTGLLVIQSSATAGHAVPTCVTLLSDPTFFTQSGGFVNGTLSFYLFNSPNAFVAGTDYDTNDDGVLDHLPTGAVALDNVAIPDTNNKTDLVYGGVTVTEITSQNRGTADAVTRFPGNLSNASAAWYGGELVDTNNVDSQLQYDPTRESANEPAGAYLTPGSFNYQRSSPAVTITSGNTVYDGVAYAPTASVTGSTGTDPTAPLSYTFYSGTGTGGSILTGAPAAAGTYTAVASFAGDSEYLAATSAAVTFRITTAAPTVSVADASGAYSGAAFAAVAKVAGVVSGVDTTPANSLGGVTPSVIYYNGSTATGAALGAAPSVAGTYTVQADFAGSANYSAGSSTAVTFTISPTTVLPAWLSASSAGNATWGGQFLNVTGPVSIISNPGASEPYIVASTAAASVRCSPASNSTEIDVGGIALSNGASMAITTDQCALVVGTVSQGGPVSFSIDNLSGLDLRDNDLIVHGGNLPLINSALTRGTTATSGIFSSVGNASIAHLTSLGRINNSSESGSPYTSLDNVPLASTDILVRYTYYGDANLSGKVDGSDYSLIDNGFLKHLTGWYNGDFNYDGVVDGSDYTLIDNTFNQQGASLAASIAVPAARLAKTNRLTAITTSPFATLPIFPSKANPQDHSLIIRHSVASEIFG